MLIDKIQNEKGEILEEEAGWILVDEVMSESDLGSTGQLVSGNPDIGVEIREFPLMSTELLFGFRYNQFELENDFYKIKGSYAIDLAALYQIGSAFQNYLEFGLYAVDNILNIAGTGNVGIGVTNPGAKFHIDSGATGATAYPFRTDAASLDYALYVSSSGNVAIGGLVPANQLNHKLVVFSGSIALRGPNEAAYSYRLNDTAGTNRNALYVSSSNYLNVGNAAFAGLQLFHTGSFDTRYTPTVQFEETRIYGNNEDNQLLGLPDNWLGINVSGTAYVIPLYAV